MRGWLDYDQPFWHVLVFLFGAIALLLVTIFAANIIGCRLNGPGACEQWGQQTGHRTKFRLIGFLDTGTCLAQLKNGRWVINSSVGAFNQ